MVLQKGQLLARRRSPPKIAIAVDHTPSRASLLTESQPLPSQTSSTISSAESPSTSADPVRKLPESASTDPAPEQAEKGAFVDDAVPLDSADILRVCDQVVSNSLWGDFSGFGRRVCGVLDRPYRTQPRSELSPHPLVAASRPRLPRLLTSGESRRELIGQTKDLKRTLAALHAHNPPGSPNEAYIQRLEEQYQEWKALVRDSCAAAIQSAFRGYLERRAISCAATSETTDIVYKTLERLKLARAEHGRPSDVDDQNVEQLLKEKHFIKRILVGFDRQFRRKHNRMPAKQDKERFRPIYRVYNRVKQLIVVRTEERDAHQQEQLDQYARSPSPSLPGPVTPEKQTKKKRKKKKQRKEESGSFLSPTHSGVPRLISSVSPVSSSSSPTAPYKDLPPALGVSAVNAGAQLSSVSDIVAELKAEKRELQIKLNRFEKTFRRLRGRRIMWESDVVTVKDDYERYKALKAELARYQGIANAQAANPS